jgi:uncharacterized protein
MTAESKIEAKVTGLGLSYIKSCALTELQTAQITENGLYLNRHWMLVDKNGNFLTARDYPHMILVVPELQEDSLVIDAPGRKNRLVVPLVHKEEQETRPVMIWKSECIAEDDGNDAQYGFLSIWVLNAD